MGSKSAYISRTVPCVSTYSDRPGSSGSQSGDRFMFTPSQSRSDATSGSTYTSQGHDPSQGFTDPDFDDQGFNESSSATTVLPAGTPVGTRSGTGGYGSGLGPGDFGSEDSFEDGLRPPVKWHGGADFGLLVLRLVVGGTAIAHGLQHVFGLFHGLGIHRFADLLTAFGYKQSNILAWVTGVTELGGGSLLVLGLFTPLAAAGLLGVLLNVIALKWKVGFFAPGYELELSLAAAAFTLMFTGPGRVSLDRPTPWFRHPVANAIVLLIIAAGAGAAVYLTLHHATGTVPSR